MTCFNTSLHSDFSKNFHLHLWTGSCCRSAFLWSAFGTFTDPLTFFQDVLPGVLSFLSSPAFLFVWLLELHVGTSTPARFIVCIDIYFYNCKAYNYFTRLTMEILLRLFLPLPGHIETLHNNSLAMTTNESV